mgnify:CR=1 FL=1
MLCQTKFSQSLDYWGLVARNIIARKKKLTSAELRLGMFANDYYRSRIFDAC